MDSTSYRSNWPKFGLRHIPDDIMIYILDFLESTVLAAMALANRHLNELITPTLYRTITIPGGGNHYTSHQISAARLIRTLMHRPSLAVLVRHLENAPPVIPSYLLGSICLGGSTFSYLGQALAEHDGHAGSQPHGLPMDVMKSCVNLRSLTVTGLVTSYPIGETDKWLNFLLDPSIKLKSLKLLAYAQHNSIKTIWNRFVAQILDAQLSLEYLEYPFDNKYPEIEKERMDKWVPELRVLCGDDVRGFKALLSRKRSIETVVVRGIPMKDIRRFFGAQLKDVDTVEELVYQGPQVDSLNFADLFETVPSLKVFSGEVWLSVVDPLEDLFLQELPQAFALTPLLTEFHLRHNNRLPTGGLSSVQPEFLHLYLPSHNKEWPKHQAALLERYSTIWPQLQVFTFPDGRRWGRMNDKWVLQDKFTRSVTG